MAITGEEVLHVAKLAQLALTDDEIEKQLDLRVGKILDAVGIVAELDLADVAPTAHPLDLVNVWDDDVPRDSPPSRGRARERARSGEGALPGPGMAPVVDTLRLTAEGAKELLQRRELTSPELRAAYLDAIEERDGELHCFLRTPESEGSGVPIALKDVISTNGVETTAGSRILEGYVPVFDATVAARVKEPAYRSSARRTRTSSQWALRPRTRPGAIRVIRGIPRAFPEALVVGRRLQSRLDSHPGRSARTPAAR